MSVDELKDPASATGEYVIRTTLRRALLPVGLIAGAVAAVTAIAALAGAPPQRAVALGLYAVGSFLVLVGFALGSRNLLRSSDHWTLRSGRGPAGFLGDDRGARLS